MDKIKLAHEVLDLVFRANGGFVERVGSKGQAGRPTAFFTFSGHCPDVDVQIFPNGWHRDADYNKDREVFTFSDWREGKELEEELNRLREYVEELEKKEEQHD